MFPSFTNLETRLSLCCLKLVRMGVKTGRLAVIEERKRGAGSFDFRGRNVLLNPPRYSATDTHVQEKKGIREKGEEKKEEKKGEEKKGISPISAAKNGR